MEVRFKGERATLQFAEKLEIFKNATVAWVYNAFDPLI